MIRARRLRSSPAIRSLVEETQVTAHDLIYPLFFKEGNSEDINSMPGQKRLSINDLLQEIEDSLELGLRAFALFPVIPNEFKTWDAKEAINPDGLTQKTIRQIKRTFGNDVILITDVALDPYTSHGHDGLVHNGKILNDETVAMLAEMALVQAEAGADIVAPSDMMDHRIKAIRKALEEANHHDTLIMSYTAKYASCLYGPFREALASLGSGDCELRTDIPQDKKTYQMNPANAREALKELDLDIQEAADIVMVKPASWYSDIIYQFKQNTHLPVAAYQVSGEYSMIQAAAQLGYIDLSAAMKESLISIKRSGADLILSYFAKAYCQEL